jgi:hypothetical protein
VELVSCHVRLNCDCGLVPQLRLVGALTSCFRLHHLLSIHNTFQNRLGLYLDCMVMLSCYIIPVIIVEVAEVRSDRSFE